MPTLTGSQANDNIIGSDTADIISGLGGDDNLVGNAGDDVIDGGSGDDILTGGSEFDTLTGGTGVDRFRDTAAGLNGDRITDLLPGDRIQITDLTIQNAGIGVSGSTITYNGGSVAVDNLGPGRLIIREIQGGGVEIRLQSNAQNDFNGDGRSDMLLRHDSGTLTNWLGHRQRQLCRQLGRVRPSLADKLAGRGHWRLQRRRPRRHAAAPFQRHADQLARHRQWQLRRQLGRVRPSLADELAGRGHRRLQWRRPRRHAAAPRQTAR